MIRFSKLVVFGCSWIAFVRLSVAVQNSCSCESQRKILVNQYLQAELFRNPTAGNALPLCTFAKRYYNVYFPYGLSSYQPGGDELSTRSNILSGVQDDFLLNDVNVTITNGPNCAVAATYFNPSNGTEFSATVLQILTLAPSLTDHGTSCYISSIATYVCFETARATCPHALGGPLTNPLPSPTRCKLPVDNGPCLVNKKPA